MVSFFDPFSFSLGMTPRWDFFRKPPLSPGPDRAQSTTSSWEKNRWNNGGPPVVPGDAANISRFIEGRGKKEDYISEGRIKKGQTATKWSDVARFLDISNQTP